MANFKIKRVLSLLCLVFLSNLVVGADAPAIPRQVRNNEQIKNLDLELKDIKTIQWPTNEIPFSKTQGVNLQKRKFAINNEKGLLQAENTRLLDKETEEDTKRRAAFKMPSDTIKTIEFVAGNIVEQRDVGAIVNAANTTLIGSAGVAKIIQDKAGPEILQALKKLAPCSVGDAVITPAYNLTKTHNIRFVISAVGPNCNDSTQSRKSDELLNAVYKRIYELAEENQLSSIAVVLMSIGIFGCLPDDSIVIGIKQAWDALVKSQHLRTIRFVLFQGDPRFEELYQKSRFNLMQVREAIYDLPAPAKGFSLEV